MALIMNHKLYQFFSPRKKTACQAPQRAVNVARWFRDTIMACGCCAQASVGSLILFLITFGARCPAVVCLQTMRGAPRFPHAGSD